MINEGLYCSASLEGVIVILSETGGTQHTL